MTRIFQFRSQHALFCSLALCVLTLAPVLTRAEITTDWVNCQRGVLNRPGAQHPTTAPAQYCVGLGYMFGYNGHKDVVLASQWLRKAADQNHAGAETTLGYNYEKGYGVPANPATALQWYRKAAAQGYPDGLFNLGRALQYGVGTAANSAEAAKYYREAAAHGSEEGAKALAQIGNSQQSQPAQDNFNQGAKLYRAKDYAGAAKLFLNAANAGNALAQRQIGYQYEYGEGVPQNYAEAVRWYAKAANQGDAKSQNNLGEMYEDAKGVRENWPEALNWYQKSAAQHDARGEFLLGRMYQFGMAVPQNRATAIAWFSRAGELGESQGAYFARWLRDPTNNIGFRNNAEHNLVIAGKLRYALGSDDPAGITFRNSDQRMAWLNGLRQQTDQREAHTMWSINKQQYDNCMSRGGSNCQSPGPQPRR